MNETLNPQLTLEQVQLTLEQVQQLVGASVVEGFRVRQFVLMLQARIAELEKDAAKTLSEKTSDNHMRPDESAGDRFAREMHEIQEGHDACQGGDAGQDE